MADHAFELLRYVPTRGTVPTLLEARLRIPAGQKMHITFALDKHFLRYTEHPPDAQRGREIPGAIFVPLLPSSPNGAESSFGPVDGARTYIHSRALLLDLATPDFSMPYNVILMTCILASVICARVFKTLTGHFVVVEVVDGSRVGGGSGGRRAS
jgi:phosphatidylinositol glycan class T